MPGLLSYRAYWKEVIVNYIQLHASDDVCGRGRTEGRVVRACAFRRWGVEVSEEDEALHGSLPPSPVPATICTSPDFLTVPFPGPHSVH